MSRRIFLCLASCFNSWAKSGVVSMLQFIEQILCLYALQLTVLHLSELAEGVIYLVKRLLLGLRLLCSVELNCDELNASSAMRTVEKNWSL